MQRCPRNSACARAPVQGRLRRGACAVGQPEQVRKSLARALGCPAPELRPKNRKNRKNSNSCDSFQKTVRDWLWAGRSRAKTIWPGRCAVLPQNCGPNTGNTGKTVIPVTLFKKQSETSSGPVGAGQKQFGQGAGLSCPRIAAQKQEKQEKQ